MKYTYSIETHYLDRWTVIVNASRDYCLGYFDRVRESAPRNAYRLMRSDGKIMHEVHAMEDVSIGQVASWPTPEQYEHAAKRALDQADRIRDQRARMDKTTSSSPRP